MGFYVQTGPERISPNGRTLAIGAAAAVEKHTHGKTVLNKFIPCEAPRAIENFCQCFTMYFAPSND